MLMYITNHTQTVMLCHTVGNGHVEIDCSTVRMCVISCPTFLLIRIVFLMCTSD